MKMSVEITGLTQTQQALDTVKNGLHPEIEGALAEGLLPIENEIASYPPRTTSYKRTGDYGASVGMTVETEGYGDIVAQVGPNLTSVFVRYAQWVRGIWQGRGPAWMHVDWWESITSIGERMIPDAIEAIQARVDSFIKGIFG